MVLTVDIGNSNIVLGVFDDDKLLFTSRIRTSSSRTSDEYAIILNDILHLHLPIASSDTRVGGFSGAIISSVVPKLSPVLKTAIQKALVDHVLVVGPGVKTGINIRTDDPSILGADFVCTAAGALAKYPLPAIIIDMGTATKFSVLLDGGVFIGTSIMPGVHISLDALASRTAQLPHISIEGIPPMIGTNTIDSMRSGVVYGAATMIDGMIERYKEAIGVENATVILTGGISGAIAPHCHSTIQLDHNLILDGLLSIYNRNH